MGLWIGRLNWTFSDFKVCKNRIVSNKHRTARNFQNEITVYCDAPKELSAFR